MTHKAVITLSCFFPIRTFGRRFDLNHCHESLITYFDWHPVGVVYTLLSTGGHVIDQSSLRWKYLYSKYVPWAMSFNVANQLVLLGV